MNNPFENIDARLSNIENLLLDIKHTSNTDEIQGTNQPDYIPIKDIIKKKPCSKRNLYTQLNAKRLKIYKFAGKSFTSLKTMKLSQATKEKSILILMNFIEHLITKMFF